MVFLRSVGGYAPTLAQDRRPEQPIVELRRVVTEVQIRVDRPKPTAYVIRRIKIKSSLIKSAIGVLPVLALAAAGLTARADPQPIHVSGQPQSPGVVFAMTNVAADNRVVAYKRASNGSLSEVASYSTGGHGKGDDFDASNGLLLGYSGGHRFLYASNAGSNDSTVFSVQGTSLTVIQKISADGVLPESLTRYGNLLYVLDESVAANEITGFTVGRDGKLAHLSGSTRPLASPIAVPGDLEFSPDGRVLVVTDKGPSVIGSDVVENVIETFQMGSDGRPGQARPNRSFGRRNFAAAFLKNGLMLVAESGNPIPNFGAISSYRIDPNSGALATITGSQHNFQWDTCWVVITNDQRYAYTANFISGTISSFRVGPGGNVALINGRAAVEGLTSQPTDLRLSADGRYLYNLLRGEGEVAAYRIESDGSLSSLGRVGGLPANVGASGLAAY